MNTNFPQIGDSVKITNNGRQYTTYQLMADKLNLTNYISNLTTKNGEIGVISGSDTGKLIYGIRLQNGTDILMGYSADESDRGFIVTSTPNILDDSLFEV